MRAAPIHGILAVALLVPLSGCVKSSPTWVSIKETRPPKVFSAGARPPGLTAIGARKTGLAAGAPRWADEPKAPAPYTAKVSDEIARRMAQNTVEWETHREETASALREQLAGKPSVVTEAGNGKPSVEQRALPDTTAVKRKYSVEYLNSRMRIAVLVSRLASAEQSERAVLTTKLDQANAALRALDEACEKEASLAGNAGTGPYTGSTGPYTGRGDQLPSP